MRIAKLFQRFNTSEATANMMNLREHTNTMDVLYKVLGGKSDLKRLARFDQSRLRTFVNNGLVQKL